MIYSINVHLYSLILMKLKAANKIFRLELQSCIVRRANKLYFFKYLSFFRNTLDIDKHPTNSQMWFQRWKS